METDYSALRQHLVSAWLQASGRDEATRRIRNGLGLLIEEVLCAENGRPTACFPFVALRTVPGQLHGLTVAVTQVAFDGTLASVKAAFPAT